MIRLRPILSDDQDSYYHCMSRCVQGRHLLDDTSREVFRKMIWKIAEFCGVHVITYALMPNHFHVLVRIPQRELVPDHELLRRYQLLHPKPNRFQTARLEVIADWLNRNSPQGIAWRNQQLALMFNLSAFMSLLKQRFSIWFNKTHQLFGALWAERFKSVLVEFDRHTLRTMAAYIDLNAVRKGLVSDPKDYRWCGYAEAVAGSKLARRGLHLICPNLTWTKAQADYRCILYSVGSAPREKGHVIPPDAFETVMTAHGELPLGDLLRHRWRYFTDASVLGSPSFVAHQRSLLTNRKSLSLTSPPPRPLIPPEHATRDSLPPTPWGGWTTLKRLNKTSRHQIPAA